MILRLRGQGQGQGQGWATEADVDHHVVRRKMLCTSYYTLRWPRRGKCMLWFSVALAVSYAAIRRCHTRSKHWCHTRVPPSSERRTRNRFIY